MSQQPIASRQPTHQSPHHDAPAPSPGVDPVVPLRGVLGQLRELVRGLGAEPYTRKPVGTFGGSVGGHVRHCLDHVEALLHGWDGADEAHGGDGRAGGLVDYDQRERGTSIETDKQAAVSKMDQLDQGLAALSGQPVDTSVSVALMLSGDGPSLRWRSTLGRELAFVLSHTIHHGAMIAAMVRTMGGQVPADFGLAPSTIAAGKGPSGQGA